MSLLTGVASDFHDLKRTGELDGHHAGLIDTGSVQNMHTVGSLTTLEAHCRDQPVRIAITNRAVSGGSFGTDECASLEALIKESLSDAKPVVLVLDSGGARLTAGLAGLGAFRRMYRAALDLRSKQVPMIALLGRNCFGGASMLAMLCNARGAVSTARLGMSGPVIIEKLAGKDDLDSQDHFAVTNLFGAALRSQAGVIDVIHEASHASSQLVAELLRKATLGAGNLAHAHRLLSGRLQQAGLSVEHYSISDAGAAFRQGRPVGALDIWRLSDALLEHPQDDPFNLIVDCPGQTASRLEETLVLSDYVVHLARCLHARTVSGADVVIRIEGESAGGIYVALAAGAGRVEATRTAVLRVLPVSAIRAVLGDVSADESLAVALATGVVDTIL